MWRRNVCCPVYIRLSLQLSLTLACKKALSKTLPNIHGAAHVPAPRLTSTTRSRCRRRWLNLSTIHQKGFLFKNHLAKFFIRGPWGKPLLRGTQRAGSSSSRTNFWTTSLGGSYFEIIPTNKISPVTCHCAGSFRFPPRARCFFHGKPAQPAILEATRPIPWYQPRTGYTALRYRSRCRWAWLWCLLAIISLHCLP